jgi:amino acid transporter
MNTQTPSARLKKEAGLIGLLFAGVGGMIGSGWLFGPLETATQAGPLSLWSWLIGGAVVLLIAMVFAELATLFPLSGALVHMSDVSHGQTVGLVWGWILILAYVAVAPIEAMAIVSYASAYIPDLTLQGSGVLTTTGFLVSAAVLAIMVGLNFLMIRTVLSVNSWVTVWKILIPIATAIILFSYAWHPENFGSRDSSTSIEGIFTAISTGGVFFSLFGFRQALDLAGESANPNRDVPISLIGTVVLGTAIYLLLQTAFIGAIAPDMLSKGTWADLHFKNIAGPLAALSAAVGAGWWASVLYADAIVSPGACGFVYTTTTSRILMANGESGTLPKLFARINARGVPWFALIATYVVGLLFFLPFPSWQKMVGYISSVTVLSYGIGPILVLCLRKSLPDIRRPFKLPAAPVIAPLAFIGSNWVILWAGFDTLNFLFTLLAALIFIHAAYFFIWQKRTTEQYQLRSTWWLAPYFVGLWVLSKIGPSELGGSNLLEFPAQVGVSAVFSLIIFYLAIHCALSQTQTREHFNNKMTYLA